MCTLSPSHSFSPSYFMRTGTRWMVKPWKKCNAMPVWFIDHLVLMKLQTRVRRMLQLHFSSSKPTTCCVEARVAPSPAYPQQQWRQFLCHTEEAGEAKEPRPAQGQMAAPSTRIWGGRATLPRLQLWNHGWISMECFQSQLQPSAGLSSFPPAPNKGLLPWSVHCPDAFPVWKLH